MPFHASSAAPARREAPEGLTTRWYGLRHHPEQYRLLTSTARFRVIPSGRRSGKTEIAKRYLVGTALGAHPEARFFAAAPTWDQAKRIWWADLKALSLPEQVADKSNGELWIRYRNGAEIWVVGTDKPERIEGTPWDGGVLDEYANMRPDVWDAHLWPVMTERHGWCWFIGVPEGRNHYYKLYQRALAESKARALIETGQLDDARSILAAVLGQDAAKDLVDAGAAALEWAAFAWPSEDVVPATELASARRFMPADLYEQEFGAAVFTAFRGRVYKDFGEATHTAPLAHRYDPKAPLLFMLDFNVAPGVAAVGQDMGLPSGETGTAIIGEVHIPHDSTTATVCRALCEEWEGHQGPVLVYGDATGGQRRTVATEQGSTDWKIARQVLRGAFERLVFKVPGANPAERDRVNNLNARILSADGAVRLMVDPVRAPHVVEDLEGVRYLEGTSEIAKTGKANLGLTHLSDALGYWASERWPIPDFSASGIQRYRYATLA